MTREDAFEIWLPIIKMGVKSMPECSEALDMAIKALKQEPCTDAISRQQAIDACLNGWNKGYEEIVEEIRALPPVTAEKVGQWIKDESSSIAYRCTVCDTLQHWSVIQQGRYHFCPNCGAKMQASPTNKEVGE